MESRVLFASDAITIAEVWCEPGTMSRSDIEVEGAFGLSLPRSGVYVHHTPEGEIVAEPTVAILRNRGDEHVTVHPDGRGDRNTDIELAPGLVEEFLDSSEHFEARTVPIDETICANHRRLVAMATRERRPALEIEEAALHLLGRITGLAPFPTSPRHRSLVDQARQLLAQRFAEDLDLPTIAREVGSSPHHLSRVFKQSTGRSLSGYRTALRIGFAIDRISGGEHDLSRIAAEAGFFDHAHMTNTFHKRLGLAPSRLRALI